jgi:hypothetical protein
VLAFFDTSSKSLWHHPRLNDFSRAGLRLPGSEGRSQALYQHTNEAAFTKAKIWNASLIASTPFLPYICLQLNTARFSFFELLFYQPLLLRSWHHCQLVHL